MRRTRSRWSLVGLITLLSATAGACGGTPTGATPTLTTETFSGTVKVGGNDSKFFNVNYALTVSDASVAITALTSAATGAALETTIGIGFGAPAFDGTCTRDPTYSSVNARVGAQPFIARSVFISGPYCVQVYDAGTLTGDANYTVTVQHY